MKCKHLMVPVISSLLLLFMAIGFLRGLSTALQIAFLNLIAMSVLQLATSGYKNGPRRNGYIIGAFIFFLLNLGVLGSNVEGLILVLILTALMLCIYELLWFSLWGQTSGRVLKKYTIILWSSSVAGVLYFVYHDGIKPLLSALFVIGVILVGYAIYNAVGGKLDR